MLLLAGLLFAAGSKAPPVTVLHGSTMGTTWTVRIGTRPPDVGEAGLREGIEAVLESVNAQMSTWREDSLLSRFNRLPSGGSIDLPDGFASVLGAALDLAEETDGAYDPTVGPLVNLWGFGPDPLRDTVPSAAEIAAARARVGWQRLAWDRKSTVLVQPGGVYLDLSSIAKGHAVDSVLSWLVAQGVDGVLVDIGGETRTRGRKPDGSPWRIAIEQPVPGPGALQRVLEPGDRAIATSGNYRNHFDVGGQRYSHTIDPRTGQPVRHELVAVSVAHGNCMQADALATALGVLGPDEGHEFALQRDLAVLFQVERDGRVVERMTPAFQRLVDEPGAQ